MSAAAHADLLKRHQRKLAEHFSAKGSNGLVVLKVPDLGDRSLPAAVHREGVRRRPVGGVLARVQDLTVTALKSDFPAQFTPEAATRGWRVVDGATEYKISEVIDQQETWLLRCIRFLQS